MQYGVQFPHVPFDDVSKARDLAQTYDGAGLHYMAVGGHVLTARLGRYEGRPERLYATPYHDPFVLLAYLAAVTSRIRLITSVAILPALQTAVVAREAIDLAFLSNDRFELGVGNSWQESEYRALGQDLHTRGARLAEQIDVLRLFWTQELVSFKGVFHDIDDMGFARLPNQPISIWGGSQFGEAAMRRIAAKADGWMTMGDPAEAMPHFRCYVTEAGRDLSAVKIMAGLLVGDDGADVWVAAAKRLQALGVTHITINPPPGMTADATVKRVIEARNILAGAVI